MPNMFNSLRRNSISSKNLPRRSNGDQYYYVKDFEQSNEKKCKKLDKLNNAIYEKNLDIFNDTNKKLENTPLKIENKPKPPPRPNNYEKLLLFRQRNVYKSVNDQTIAIIYLMSKGYKFKLPRTNEGIEPFQAIDIVEKMIKETGDDIFDEIKKFQTQFKKWKVNGFEFNKLENVGKRKIIKTNSFSDLELEENNLLFTKTLDVINNSDFGNKPSNVMNNLNINNYNNSVNNDVKTVTNPNRNSNHVSEIRNELVNDNKLENNHENKLISKGSRRRWKDNSNCKKLVCQNPEHHCINDKIKHFDSKNSINSRNSVSNKNKSNSNLINTLNTPQDSVNQKMDEADDDDKGLFFSKLPRPSAPPPYIPQTTALDDSDSSNSSCFV
tara:strand:- start:686 stop:1834 length:1149 start_codon:yes stop_codon:yes gene_type:complete